MVILYDITKTNMCKHDGCGGGDDDDDMNQPKLPYPFVSCGNICGGVLWDQVDYHWWMLSCIQHFS
jgi:hypothetical protein